MILYIDIPFFFLWEKSINFISIHVWKSHSVVDTFLYVLHTFIDGCMYAGRVREKKTLISSRMSFFSVVNDLIRLIIIYYTIFCCFPFIQLFLFFSTSIFINLMGEYPFFKLWIILRKKKIIKIKIIPKLKNEIWKINS